MCTHFPPGAKQEYGSCIFNNSNKAVSKESGARCGRSCNNVLCTKGIGNSLEYRTSQESRNNQEVVILLFD